MYSCVGAWDTIEYDRIRIRIQPQPVDPVWSPGYKSKPGLARRADAGTHLEGEVGRFGSQALPVYPCVLLSRVAEPGERPPTLTGLSVGGEAQGMQYTLSARPSPCSARARAYSYIGAETSVPRLDRFSRTVRRCASVPLRDFCDPPCTHPGAWGRRRVCVANTRLGGYTI